MSSSLLSALQLLDSGRDVCSWTTGGKGPQLLSAGYYAVHDNEWLLTLGSERAECPHGPPPACHAGGGGRAPRQGPLRGLLGKVLLLLLAPSCLLAGLVGAAACELCKRSVSVHLARLGLPFSA